MKGTPQIQSAGGYARAEPDQPASKIWEPKHKGRGGKRKAAR